MKKYRKHLQTDDILALQTEVDILSQVDHPNVVKLYEIYEDKKHFYMVLELMTGGEVSQYPGKPTFISIAF